MEKEAKHKQSKETEEFILASIDKLSSSSSSSSTLDPNSTVTAKFSSKLGFSELRFCSSSDTNETVTIDLQTAQLFKLSPVESACFCEASETSKEQPYSRGITIRFREEEESKGFHCAFNQWKKEADVKGSQLPNGTLSTSKSKFDEKIEPSSAKMYFHYYGQLLHQQNMLQDYVRTGTYYAAVIENRVDFTDRVVVDVGAGSGILSLFAAQAGARHVYVVVIG